MRASADAEDSMPKRTPPIAQKMALRVDRSKNVTSGSESSISIGASKRLNFVRHICAQVAIPNSTQHPKHPVSARLAREGAVGIFLKCPEP